MRKSLLLPLALLSSPLMAADLEQPDQSHAADLAVWYDLKLKDREGEKWLKDLRQWWRRSGRSLEMPVDGVSSATRAVGSHSLTFEANQAPLKDLPPGDYRLVVEAAREVGGRELLRVPFSWPPTQQQAHQAQGESELGAVFLTLNP